MITVNNRYLAKRIEDSQQKEEGFNVIAERPNDLFKVGLINIKGRLTK